MSGESPIVVSCSARLAPTSDSPDSLKLPCVLPYGHLVPRMHRTADGEEFSYEAGIEAIRPEEKLRDGLR